MEKVKFEVTLDEAKKIFEALGKLPFAEVYELIGKLNDQANDGFKNNATGNRENGYNTKDQNDFLK
ncbi:hypothetical protein LVD17_20195 [Fulvivirga ulvae]|uniref:hypothetical protein n=1 Tax=Fulvivirga ulvae TaxID=2904245 RepID=UPI001F37A314|nr:hypothetical protein [Fulvivirga ulvae]UII30617.1 hypothetical protein LVD17_20195 [Fulvivirga ulvae]